MRYLCLLFLVFLASCKSLDPTHLSTVNSQLSTVNCQLSTVHSQLSTANSQLSIVNCQQPYIYSARNISSEDIPVVHHNGMPLSFSQDIQQEFVTHLQSLINEILDTSQPFAPTNDTHTCESCAFFSLCHATI